MAHQQEEIPAARKPHIQDERKVTRKGIEIGSFEQPRQKISYTSDQSSQYHSSQAQGATVRKQDHAATASPTVEMNQIGQLGAPKEAGADADVDLDSSFGGVGIKMDRTDSPLKPPYDENGGTGGGGIKRMEMVCNFQRMVVLVYTYMYLDAYPFIL